MKIVSVVGARPNFMKIAPFIRAIHFHNESKRSPEIEHILVHTGQHYDNRMSAAFLTDLELPEIDINLGIGSGSHAEQVGQTMIEFEKVIKIHKPDWVVVVGDVNATLACSITAKKEWIKCCHIEAGLRSGDMTMPEEINRLVTDRLSDLLLTPDRISTENLIKEGVPRNQIVLVGNIMIDTLDTYHEKAKLITINEIIDRNYLKEYRLNKSIPGDKNYILITMHRPSNVDDKETFQSIIRLLMNDIARDLRIIWPVHPRARKQMVEIGVFEEVVTHPNIFILEPLNYFDMLRLNIGASLVMTDSGGLQEECTVLGTPCLTLRWNTERPITLRENGGLNVLVGNNLKKILIEFNTSLKSPRIPFRPEFWDGHAANRCLDAILTYSNISN